MTPRPAPLRAQPRHCYAGESSGARTEQPGRPTPEEVQSRLAATGVLDRRTSRSALTPAQVLKVKALRGSMTLKELGELFGRHPSRIAAYAPGVDLRRREARETE